MPRCPHGLTPKQHIMAVRIVPISWQIFSWMESREGGVAKTSGHFSGRVTDGEQTSELASYGHFVHCFSTLGVRVKMIQRERV